MPWTKGILLFIIVVMTLISSLRAGPGAFSETGAVHEAVSENTIRFGKLLIEERFHLAEAKLHRLSPSVYCGNDSMTLRIPGAIRTPHFLVDRGDQSLVPLSEIPAHCGFSLKRARRDVSLVAPYQGCHVRLQDGSYVLPLLVMGAPVQMSCPASRLIPTVSCFPSSMTISFDNGVDVKVKVAGSWQPLLLTSSKCSFTLETVDGSLSVTAPFTGSCLEVKDSEIQLHLMYGDQEVTLSCPVTLMPAPTTIAPVQDPLDSQQMFYPFPFGKPWWYRPYSPGYPLRPTVPPPKTMAVTTKPAPTPIPPVQDPLDSQQMFYPFPFGKPWWYRPYSPGYPLRPTVPPPKTMAVTTKLAPTPIPPVQDPLDSQQMFYPFPFGKPWWYRPHSPGYPLRPTVPPPSTTTAVAPPPLQDPNQHVFPNMYPMSMFDPYLHPSGSAAKWPRYPMFPPYMYPLKSPVEATTPSTTTLSTTTAARFDPLMYPKFYRCRSFKSFVPPGVKHHFMP